MTWYLLIGANLLLALAVGWLAVRVRRFHEFATRLSIEKGKLITPEMIRVWRQQAAKLPEHHPRHKAYVDNLKAAGQWP